MIHETKKAYSEILKLLNKHKGICDFDIESLETKSKFHLFGLELKEVYGLDINPKNIRSLEWVDCGEYRYIGLFGSKNNRTISWSDDGKQPTDEMLVCFKFPTGAYIFGDDYPTDLFQKFFLELKEFNPDYSDSTNHCLYFSIAKAKDVFNSFEELLKKYYELNKEDQKQRRIKKMKDDLTKLETS